MRIGLDIDGVMYKWDNTARYMLRNVLPDSPYKDDENLMHEATYWNYIPDHVAPEHWEWLWKDGVKLGLFRYGNLYKGTIQAVRHLATLGDVVLITHRPAQAVTDTLAWLGLMDLPIKGLHLLTNQEAKSGVRPYCDVYLDDKPENVEDLKRNTSAKLVCLREQPWNLNIPTGKSIRRVQGWATFMHLVESLSGHLNA